MNDAGVPCPSAADPGRNPHRTGEGWTLRTVAAILANPRYTGRQVWNRQRTGFDLADPANTGLGHKQAQRWNLPEGWVMGLLLQLLLLASRRILLLSWTGSASGWRSPRKLGAAQAVTDAGALDGARFEVAVDATGAPEASRPRRAARPWRADGGLRCVASPGRDQRLAVPGL